MSVLKDFKKRIPKPMFVRANDYKRVGNANYIIRRNEHTSAVRVIGKAYRRLPTDLDVQMALKNGKSVAQWGSKFFLYTRVHAEDGRLILKEIWEEEDRRGIPRPECSDYDKESFDI